MVCCGPWLFTRPRSQALRARDTVSVSPTHEGKTKVPPPTGPPFYTGKQCSFMVRRPSWGIRQTWVLESQLHPLPAEEMVARFRKHGQ